MSHVGNGLPGWTVSGSGFLPEMVQRADRIHRIPDSEWHVAFDFRANGEERSGGNIQLWYVKQASAVGTSSIYTVGKFDGLAITIDTHGGRAGIRGFLNDGTTDYKGSGNVDALAFGHCDYQYRNLGRPSKLQVKQSSREFEVLIDGNTCFKTPKVFIPPGNVFGITAASAESPDSFEAFRFVATTYPGNNQQQERRQESQHRPGQANYDKAPTGSNVDIKDLQDRLQAISSTTNKLIDELHALSATSDDRLKEIIRMVSHRDQVSSVDQRLQRVERMVESMQREVEGKDYHHQFRQLQDLLHNSHSGLLDTLHDSSHRIISAAPRMGFFIVLIIAVQLLLAVAYVVYKKRRASMPKKFL
ncbi:lectin family integral membrane protein, putative [Trichophyton verrucosum HKI 0517]|uniref:Lectin family integral membrane protein, putative n=1 Tax=Trichophyton verrucosum (strain HKI 0517) TaxID=663202 RepID=D4D5X8_TRIVH|nr:lectin family integral membrane protein, putative [Trichophyton verrucosum HKI 0517]EFE42781.1 lectin family integral membrane protein, putative [Trichophyton verrucosum HKI 0517]